MRILQSFAFFAKFQSVLTIYKSFSSEKLYMFEFYKKKLLRFCPRESFYLLKCLQLPKMCTIKSKVSVILTLIWESGITDSGLTRGCTKKGDWMREKVQYNSIKFHLRLFCWYFSFKHKKYDQGGTTTRKR